MLKVDDVYIYIYINHFMLNSFTEEIIVFRIAVFILLLHRRASVMQRFYLFDHWDISVNDS